MKNENDKKENVNLPPDKAFSRRSFLHAAGAGAAAFGLLQIGCTATKKTQQKPAAADTPKIAGFEKAATDESASKDWVPVSDWKIRVGLIGYGVCKFAAQFGFQDHPNVEVAAVSDLFPDRCAELAKVTRCNKTYPSLEELIKDNTIEAVFIATDAPSHARHAIAALEHGKHVACAVPAVFNSVEDAYKLYDAVKRSGKKYMMFETSAYHADVHEMRELYKLGAFGKLIYSEGEYYHYFGTPLGGYKNWREGMPPMFYPTHATAYHICVSGASFTEVSCLGLRSTVPQYQPSNNVYKSGFGTQVALFRTSDNASSRMTISWDTPGFGAEAGRIRGEKGSYTGKYQGIVKGLPAAISRPPIPPTMQLGGHGGAHGPLTNEFVTALLQNRHPLVDVATALNLTVPGAIAHESSLKDGEWMKIPQFKMW
ncbi:Gfo/Idh/MocA family protein [Niabella aurantiaca]|uniref:Gfo/Idh/MocA family protein n=1 Tax=Niabella aurantiaca TaxID=379900 RepID=UPI000361511C|nr:Gfo/Idh/MocA family oxidoreductase [Niabella aurantiaca]